MRKGRIGEPDPDNLTELQTKLDSLQLPNFITLRLLKANAHLDSEGHIVAYLLWYSLLLAKSLLIYIRLSTSALPLMWIGNFQTHCTKGNLRAFLLINLLSATIEKSTVADKSTLHLATIVIEEIRVQGSRCGPFAPAIRALSLQTIEVHPLISARYSLDDGIAAFEHATKPGVLKVLVRV